MRVLRGRASDPEADREVTARLLGDASDGSPGLRVWAPHRQVAFGRRDARESGYERAKAAAAAAGYGVIERDVGGRAVAYTGDTLAFALALPLGDAGDRGGAREGRGGSQEDRGGIAAGRGGIDERYAFASRTLRSGLRAVGAAVADGEPPRSFCPGAHSVRVVDGGKLSGIAQRVRSDAALVAGCLVVSEADAAAIETALEPVYDALDVPFDPDSVGSVAAAGGPADAKRVARTVERAFVEATTKAVGRGDATAGDGRYRVERVDSGRR